MRGVLLLFLFLLSLFCSSCFTSNNKKSPLQLKREDGKCNGNYLRQQDNAIHPKELKTAYFAINDKGDTMQVDYKMHEKGRSIGFSLLGYDTVIPLVSFKGKPYSGKSLGIDLHVNDPNYVLSGCYVTIKKFQNGLPKYTDIYYPNGQLKTRVKGINRGVFSDLKLEYDFNGKLLELQCKQQGLYLGYRVTQKNSKFKVKRASGYKLVAIDSAHAYEDYYVVERIISNEMIDYKDGLASISTHRYEKILIQNYYNQHTLRDSTDLQCTFFDYLGESPRYFSYVIGKHDPDTVLRLQIEYLKDGGIKSLGQYFMNQRHGVWNYFNDDGSLKDVELYSEGRKHFSLHDENAFIYFHVLYDKENGEVLQYKNDWSPHCTPDSMLLYNFNDYIWHRHERKIGGYFEFWEINHPFNIRDKRSFQNYLRTLYRKEFYEDSRTKSIGFVTDKGEKTGVWIDFSHQGDTVSICDYYYGKPNGMYRKYINEVLVEKRDEIPEWRKDDPWFFLSIPYEFPKGQFFKRRNYWFSHWQEK